MHNYKIVLFLTLMGCCYQMASANEDCSPPDWFNDESFLTQSGYYVSVGKGSSLKTAEDDALSVLGRTVSSEISSRIIIENKLTNSNNKSYSQEEVNEAVSVGSNPWRQLVKELLKHWLRLQR